MKAMPIVIRGTGGRSHSLANRLPQDRRGRGGVLLYIVYKAQTYMHKCCTASTELRSVIKSACDLLIPCSTNKTLVTVTMLNSCLHYLSFLPCLLYYVTRQPVCTLHVVQIQPVRLASFTLFTVQFGGVKLCKQRLECVKRTQPQTDAAQVQIFSKSISRSAMQFIVVQCSATTAEHPISVAVQCDANRCLQSKHSNRRKPLNYTSGWLPSGYDTPVLLLNGYTQFH